MEIVLNTIQPPESCAALKLSKSSNTISLCAPVSLVPSNYRGGPATPSPRFTGLNHVDSCRINSSGELNMAA